MNSLRFTEFAQTLRKARDTTLCRGNRGADPIGLRRDVQLCVPFRHPRRGDRKLRETVDLADRLAVKPALRLEVTRLASDPHRMARSGESGDRAGAAFSGHEPPPRRVHIRAERSNSAQAGDDNAPLTAHRSLIPRRPRQKFGKSSSRTPRLIQENPANGGALSVAG